MVNINLKEQTENIDNVPINYSESIKRIIAILFDFIVLSILIILLQIIFEGLFDRIGNLVMFFVDLGIALIYFGLGNSKLTNGQTLGKRIFKLQTIDSKSTHLSIQKSLLRASTYTVPIFLLFYLNKEYSTNNDLVTITIFSLLKTLLFIFPLHLILNIRTNQTVSDILFRTYVLTKENSLSQPLKESKKWPIFISVIIFVISVSLTINNYFESHKYDYITLQISHLDGVKSSSVVKKSSFNIVPFDKEISLQTNIYILEDLIPDVNATNTQSIGLDSMTLKALKIVINKYPELDNINSIEVNLIYETNNGNKKYTNKYKATSGKVWRELLK